MIPLSVCGVFRNLSVLSRQLMRQAEQSVHLSIRHYLVLGVLLLFQLLVTYVFS